MGGKTTPQIIQKPTEVLETDQAKKLDVDSLNKKVEMYIKSGKNLDVQELTNLILIQKEGNDTVKNTLKDKRNLFLETFVSNLIRDNKGILDNGSKFEIENDGQDYGKNNNEYQEGILYNDDDIDDIELSSNSFFNIEDIETKFKGKYALLMNKLGITARDVIEELYKQKPSYVDKDDVVDSLEDKIEALENYPYRLSNSQRTHIKNMRNQIKEIESMVEYDEALTGSAKKEAPDKYKVVSENDTLSKMFPKNWKEVAKLNKIKPPYKIFTGDKIKYK